MVLRLRVTRSQLASIAHRLRRADRLTCPLCNASRSSGSSLAWSQVPPMTIPESKRDDCCAASGDPSAAIAQARTRMVRADGRRALTAVTQRLVLIECTDVLIESFRTLRRRRARLEYLLLISIASLARTTASDSASAFA